MSRIISYPYDNDIKDADAWIGSEASTTRTKQYTAQAVANYLNINGKISIGGQMTYQYVQNPLQGAGTFSITSGGLDNVPFANITALTLSITDKVGQNVVAFLDYLVGSDILISKQNEVSSFGHYGVVSYVVSPANPAFYNLVVDVKGSNGSMNFLDIYEAINFTLASEIVGSYTFNVNSDNGTITPIQNNDTINFGSSNITVSNVGSAISFNLPVTGITPGPYTSANITVDAFGRVTEVADGTSGPGGTGTTNFVPKWTNATTLGDSIIFDDGTRVGIGTTSPSHVLTVLGSSSNIIVAKSTGTTAFSKYVAAGQTANVSLGATSGNNLSFRCDGGKMLFNVGNVATQRLRATIDESGNLFMGGNGAGGTIDSRLSVFGNLNETLTGTVTINLGGTTVVGVGTLFLTELAVGDAYGIGDEVFTIATITDNLNLTVTQGSPEQKDNTVHFKDSFNLIALGNGDRVKKVVVNSDGKVGIGTTSPLAKLHVRSAFAGNFAYDTAADDFIVESNANGGLTIATASANTGRIIFASPNDPTGAELSYTSSGSLMKIGTNGVGGILALQSGNGTEAMRILANGDVGIGITLPAEKLDVNGNIRVKDEGEIYIKGSTNSRKIVRLDNTTDRGLITLDRSDVTKVVISADFVNGGHTYFNGQNANVGIGLTNPSQKLHVEGSARITGAYYDSNNETGTTGQVLSSTVTGTDWVDAGGGGGGPFLPLAGGTVTGDALFTADVGIGTTNPTRKLEVLTNSTTDAVRIKNLNDAGGGLSVFAGDGGEGSNRILTLGAGNEVIKAVVLENGNVGIGTTAPQAKLDVNENRTFDDTSKNLAVLDFNISGSTPTTGDKLQTGLRIDLDDTTTGGDAANEVRLNGINSTIDTSGTADVATSVFATSTKTGTDNITTLRGVQGNTVITTTGGNVGQSTGGYFQALAKGNSGTPTTSNMYGVLGVAQTQTNAFNVVSNLFGASFKAEAANSSNGGGAGTITGVFSEVEKDNNTLNTANAYVYRGILDGNGGTFTNTYLMRLDYGISGSTVSGNKYGIYVSGADKNFVAGNLGIDTNNPSEKLVVASGNIRLTDGFKIQWSSNDNNSIYNETENTIFRTNGNERLRITNIGSVGVGTTTPQAKLDVNGPIRVGTAQTVAATSANVGSIRYRAGSNNSYMEMVMQTGAGVADFAWVIIKQNTW